MKKGSALVIILIVGVLTFAGGYFIYTTYNQSLQRKQNKPTTITPVGNQNSSETKEYQSKSLDFSINIPKSYKSKEGQTFVELENENGTIEFVRNGTNFNNLENYLKELDSTKNLEIKEEKWIEINSYDAKMRVETNLGSKISQKIYYFYAQGWVYAISTKSESLYDNLDQIAQSFRYTPN